MNGDARQSKSGQQGGPYRSRIESKILDVRGKDFGLRSLQPDRHVQLLAKVVDSAIDLFVGHAQPSCLIDARSAKGPLFRCENRWVDSL
jgi:hypothetical protein